MATVRVPHVRRAIILTAAIAALGVALTGCSNSSKSTSSSAPGGRAEAAPPAGASDGAGSAPGAAPIDPATLQRSIIYQGTIVVRVDDVNVAAASASTIAIGAGGYVGGDDRVVDAGRSSATLVLRVPAVKFDAAVEAISGLGRETSRTVSTQDVTAQVIDIDSRVKTQQASVTRIRALLAQAKSISDIVSIEGELTRREADLESLQAQQRSLSDLTSLSTITVSLLGPAATPAKNEPKQTGFIGGLKAGWHTFLASLKVLLTIIGALLPFIIVIGVPLLIVLWIIRRRSRQARQSLATSAGAVSNSADNSSTAPANPGSSG